MKRRNIFWYLFGAVLPIAIGVFYIWYSNLQLEKQSSYILKKYNSTCIECHGKMTGLSPLHAQVNCISCHKGDNTKPDKVGAHDGMFQVPGNFADAGETCGACHKEAVEHINSSLMASNSGIIAIDKYVFGEEPSPNTLQHVDNIGNSMADEHLRALCLRCHLGSDKKIYGPIDEMSRGGGCNACHLNYSEVAANELKQYNTDGSLPQVHPSLDLQISDNHCFGCHSRSGRISTNYEGYHETLLTKEDVLNQEEFRELQDGRIFKQISEDVHHERGLACIDCHGYDDVMGDGTTYLHEEDAVKISCEDCHTNSPISSSLAALSYNQQRIFKIREFDHQQPILLTNDDSVAIINGYVDTNGQPRLLGKLSGQAYLLKEPSSSCTKDFGHNTLTCTSCHTQWAPQCIGCHVTYEENAAGYDLLDQKPMDGSWVEYAGSFLYGPPTLGVRETNGSFTVEPAIPGMIMTVDKASFPSHAMPEDTSFYRLFAPASPHTIGAVGRDCKSCHNNPLALGYGRGNLELVEAEEGWQWQFTSEYENLASDNLPADAWTGFLQEPSGVVSTRTNFRPFTTNEQKRILRVGACLTCHDSNSHEMKNSLHSDFNLYLKVVSEKCTVVYP
jgi:hypothetical protein